jgi:hypothetical protein
MGDHKPPFAFRVHLGASRVKIAVALAPGRATPLGIAAAHAVQQACANPGCLVRVYFRSLDEANHLIEILYDALTKIHRLDLRRTQENIVRSQDGEGAPAIELTNGSGIELLPEVDLRELNPAGP